MLLKRMTMAVTGEGLRRPMASKTSATAECLPSREPKLCEKPAIPMLSKLRGNQSGDRHAETWQHSRNTVHPARDSEHTRNERCSREAYQFWTSMSAESTEANWLSQFVLS